MVTQYDAIRCLIESLAAEGVSPDWLMRIEADMINRLGRAREDRKAHDNPRMNCPRSTRNKRANRWRTRMRLYREWKDGHVSAKT